MTRVTMRQQAMITSQKGLISAMQAELARRDREVANAYRQRVAKAVNEADPACIDSIFSQEVQDNIEVIDNIEREVKDMLE